MSLRIGHRREKRKGLHVLLITFHLSLRNSKITIPQISVIPAKARTQTAGSSPWIPAYAGMTE